MKTTEVAVMSALGRLAGLAERMLPQMVIREGPDAGLFCHRLRLMESGGLEQVGVSVRYTAITLIGVAEYFGSDALGEEPWAGAMERLSAEIDKNDLCLGDLGLLLWLDQYAGRWTDRLYHALTREWPKNYKGSDTMQRSWVLKGLSANTRLPWSKKQPFAIEVLAAILSAFDSESGLFVLNADAPRRGNQSYQRILGSFASQVYPLVALSAYCERTTNGDRSQVLDVIASAAETMCELQGERGQWWWIFDARTRSVFMDYPVYSVHQDGMGPMALLSAGRALKTTQFLPFIQDGIDYLADKSELTQERFIDDRLGMIWRAIIKDTPGEDVADLPYGLGSDEMQWVRTAGALPWGRQGRRITSVRFRMLREARPYCCGWIFSAMASAR